MIMLVADYENSLKLFNRTYAIFIFMFKPRVRSSPRVGKHGYHEMILRLSYHDHGETWSWSYHDDGMAAMLLGMVVMIHGMLTMFSMILTMIMVWSWWFPCFLFEKMDCLSMFFHTVSAIYQYMAQLTGLRGYYVSKLQVSKIERNFLQK